MNTDYSNILPEDPINFILPVTNMNIIKVIGVGGGGSNAVNHMYRQGITDVSFVVCNTDDQALRKSPVPEQIQLGADITHGLGAGNNPARAREAAEASLADIERMLSDNTRMAFITAGMGGGTGTGAAPVIAEAARRLGILTVGIVTIPFAFEGKQKIKQALLGVAEMSKHVDALLVINNDKLRLIYPDLELSNAFDRADDILTQAAKGIAEIITVEGYINVDFADVYTTMKDGGVAVMNTGAANGERRISRAIENALTSPLLNNNDIQNSKKILLNIYCSTTNQVRMDEISEIHEFMAQMGDDIEVIWGATFDEHLGDDVKITLIATGAGMEMIPKELRHDQNTVPEVSTAQQTSPPTLVTPTTPVLDHTPQVSAAASLPIIEVQPPKPIHQVQPASNKPVMPWQKQPINPTDQWMNDLYQTESGKNTPAEPIISLDDMDDDDFLRQIENTPAFKRQ